MYINRRFFIASLGVVSLVGCGATAQTAQTSTAVPSDLVPVRNAEFTRWVAGFRSRATGRGVSAGVFDAAFTNAGYLPGVITRDRNQIQTRRTLEDYLSIVASDERIAKGRQAMVTHGPTLDAIAARYGVETHIVAAIWGVESQFGEKRGDIPIISAMATLAYDGRRGAFYESQLLAALQILERGDTSVSNLRGSWAGAMGHTQFIPTSYLEAAVDFNGDGRRDIWSDDPADSLASTANYLARNGWRMGLRWGSEAGTGGPDGRLLQPQAGGVQFLVTRNFDVLKTYNNSDFYAIGIGHLADRLAGAGPLQGSFPPDENGLTKQDRMTIQRGLTSRGYDVGGIDGVFGRQSEAAIKAFEASQGLPVTGTATRALLARLR